MMEMAKSLDATLDDPTSLRRGILINGWIYMRDLSAG